MIFLGVLRDWGFPGEKKSLTMGDLFSICDIATRGHFTAKKTKSTQIWFFWGYWGVLGAFGEKTFLRDRQPLLPAHIARGGFFERKVQKTPQKKILDILTGFWGKKNPRPPYLLSPQISLGVRFF